tara:strand:- start:3929 stop:5701 length:1773 start_codon:yes stop_codon:yes gene_type:complete
MPGGLLNLVSYGNQNIMINGNPTKTMFKTTYAKHTNFGLQKFRIDYEGSKTLNMTASSHFDFKVPRYADLLMDTYLVVQLPHIWSPIIPPTSSASNNFDSLWRPYEFKWIKNLGTQMIERVRFTIGGQVIQEYTGQYLTNMVERDFDDAKKKLYYNMTGNTAEFNDPANSEKSKNMNQYPNAYYCAPPDTPEPSIRGKKLYIPLNIWFTLSSKMAFPLTALQYNEFHIEIDIRPVNELFVIRNIISDESSTAARTEQEASVYGTSMEHIHIYHNNYYHKPDFNDEKEQLHRFIQPPPDISLRGTSYTNKRTDWKNDIHLISTYAFLTEEEGKVFSENSHDYLIKQVYQHDINNIIGPQRTKIDTNGLVSNFMWYFQRNDVNMRNEWSNYTNWPFDFIPTDIFSPSDISNDNPNNQEISQWSDHDSNNSITPQEDGDGTPSGILITGKYVPENEKTILKTLGILFDGKYRENPLDEGVFNYVEKYVRTSGNAPEGLYFYNFGIKTNPMDIQPMGGVNLSKFKDVEFEYNVMTPNIKDDVEISEICDSDGNVIATHKPLWKLYEYNYNLTIFEERYNILSFMSGNANLKYSR